ncbi:MAG TPA: right-handed parallel beta-helix repeat-containing protein [Thermoleophilaceae bacterium]|nr:right-handed parallel beta-helix repeat-containing protein [Thermoleophilaceae bacterium]
MQRLRITVLAGFACLLLAAAPRAGAAPATAVLPCSEGAERATLTESVRLHPSSAYTGGFDITASNVVLDCRGATIDGTGRGGTGILIGAPADADLSGVVIRNCAVRGFLNGIRITRDGFRGLGAGHEYEHGIRDVVIERSRVSDSRGVGIFVDGYVTRTTIRDTTVTRAGSSGIYLEAGSAGNVVTRNAILRNGFGENGPAGDVFSFSGARFRFWGIGREGLSVDGSRRNLVSSNRFEGNSAGGVFLYTNCGEYVRSRPERWFERRYGADDNVIARNRFKGGVNGVWVASRMGESTLPMGCSDPAYVERGLKRITLDRAARNRLLRNSFRDVTYGVRVEDDDTKVLANRFAGPDATHHAVVIGTPERTAALGRPVRGTVLVRNSSAIRGNPFPYRWVEGEADTVVARNRALGRRVGICEAETLPRGPFVMTLAFALEPEGSPVTPAPDLTVPTVGALAPCSRG